MVSPMQLEPVPPPGDAARWFAVATQPRRECYAGIHLARQGFQSYIAKRQATVRHARKTQQRTVSYFPGYLFVHLDLLRQRWRSINGTHGVRHLVMQGDRPLPAPPGLIEQMQSMTNAAGYFAPDTALAPGDRVRLLDGPFTNTLATVETMNPDGRVQILMAMLRGDVPASVDRGVLCDAL